MIMMRSTTTTPPSAGTKMVKPPPPVPPRPSKSLIAEALAKTRKSPENHQVRNPIRAAPPPPKPMERALDTPNTRTVIFQSPKIVAKKVERSDSVNSTNENSKQTKSPLIEDNNKHWDQMLNDRNHVNTLIDEMFASVLEVAPPEEESKAVEEEKSVVVIDVKVEDTKSNASTTTNSLEKKCETIDDRLNHELLVSELESMRIEDEKISKRQRKPSKEIYDSDSSGDSATKILHSDWVEVSDGQEVRLSSCQITIDDKHDLKLDYERIKTMSSLHGLPPLPKSLSGFNLLEGQTNNKPPTPVRTTSIRQSSGQGQHLVYPPHPKDAKETGRKGSNMDVQLAILRREMYSLRQLDLSLLSQLWSLNESIQDFRQILQDQEDRVLSPPSPSPAPSSGDEGEGDDFYMSTSSMNNFRTPPPPPVRRPSSSSNASSLG